jgi:hypothetical protein
VAIVPHSFSRRRYDDEREQATRTSGLDLRDRHAAGEISRHGLTVARGRLESQLSDPVFPPKANAASERLARHL